MEENSRYAVGIDIGTTTVRAVIGQIDATTGTPTIIGVGQAPNNGMRKGVIVNLNGPAQAIDSALGEAERMSGYQVNAATISINGQHILSTKADGMVAVGSPTHEVSRDDLMRIEEVATLGKVPANREVLEVVPHKYRLDGQDGIKDPLGMTGTRLEISANVVSVLAPYLGNLHKTAELAKVQPHVTTPTVLASAQAVLRESQIENGVAVIDLGGATTGLTIFEEGDLQYVAVIPLGGVNITNDLAIGLKTDPEIAEKVKLAHAVAIPRQEAEGISIKHNDKVYSFSSDEIDEIVEARLEEIFEAVQKELKKASRAGQLPSGVILTGGTAKLKNIAELAKIQLGLAAQVGKPSGFGGVAEQAEEPDFAAAVGLMLIDAENSSKSHYTIGSKKKVGGIIAKLSKWFKL
ncbi:MAG: cell division protein FtsA [Candidatus Paceibacterota bacterium]|jgi:cell division protein FtsA